MTKPSAERRLVDASSTAAGVEGDRAPDRWVPVAVVARAHGVRGELRLRVHNPDSDLLLARPRVALRAADGELRAAKIERARAANGAILAFFEGVGDRDAADALRGREVCVRRSDFPKLDDGEFYVCDVLGAEVVDAGGPIGRVVDWVSYPSVDVLVVERPVGRKLEIPVLEHTIEGVDVVAGVVRVAEGTAEEFS